MKGIDVEQNVSPMNQDANSPVSVIREIHVQVGKEKMFESLMSALIQVAVHQPGHLGATVVKPSDPTAPYRLIYKFASRAQMEAWHNSQERERLMVPVRKITRSDAFETFEGLETWFDLPNPGSPPRWKTTLISWCAIYPTALLISWILSPLPFQPSLPLRTLLLTAGVVPTVAYFTGPIMFKIFRPWLNRQRGS